MSPDRKSRSPAHSTPVLKLKSLLGSGSLLLAFAIFCKATSKSVEPGHIVALDGYGCFSGTTVNETYTDTALKTPPPGSVSATQPSSATSTTDISLVSCSPEIQTAIGIMRVPSGLATMEMRPCRYSWWCILPIQARRIMISGGRHMCTGGVSKGLLD